MIFGKIKGSMEYRTSAKSNNLFLFNRSAQEYFLRAILKSVNFSSYFKNSQDRQTDKST